MDPIVSICTVEKNKTIRHCVREYKLLKIFKNFLKESQYFKGTILQLN